MSSVSAHSSPGSESMVIPAPTPKVVATGEGAVAERILEHAHAAGVPVREDPALAAALASMSLGREVPEELWMAVAEILVWAYGLEGRAITPNR